MFYFKCDCTLRSSRKVGIEKTYFGQCNINSIESIDTIHLVLVQLSSLSMNIIDAHDAIIIKQEAGFILILSSNIVLKQTEAVGLIQWIVKVLLLIQPG